uniref:Large ribosomal subunit protein uL23m n=1 Tax=Saimiri boliviensis boliviensis TaxID=39432 RepID=A0A2K6TCI1_SAIBB
MGGPQLRVFRTNFFIQLVRPGTAQPEDTVQFRIPMEMTRVDLRNYLERIYNVPVAAVRTRVQHGANSKRDHRNVRIKKPDYKVAYVVPVLLLPCVPHPRPPPLCLQHLSQLTPCTVASVSWGPGMSLRMAAGTWAAVVGAPFLSVAS